MHKKRDGETGTMKIPAEAAVLHGTAADMLDVKGGKVHSIAPDATVYDAVARMDELRVGALLVMRDDVLVGIISERDYTRKIILLGRASRDTLVEEVMSSSLITVRPDTGLNECLEIVTDRHVRHLPVVEDGRVVGMLSIGDLVRAVVSQQADLIRNLKSYIGSDYPV